MTAASSNPTANARSSSDRRSQIDVIRPTGAPGVELFHYRLGNCLAPQLPDAYAITVSGGGDARKQGELRVECKYTDKEKFSLTLEVLDQIRTQATKGGLEAPVLQLSFGVGYLANVFAIFPFEGDHTFSTAVGWGCGKQKQVTLNRADLIGDLLEFDEIHLEFERDKKEIWVVRSWSDYLNTLETEEEC